MAKRKLHEWCPPGEGEFPLVRAERICPLCGHDNKGKVLDTGVEDGLDVFVRQPDGSWKIHLSHAFTT